MKLFLIFFLFLFFSSNIIAIDIDENIAKLRLEYNKDQKEKELIKTLKAKNKLRKIYIQEFKAEQECQRLGIDCKTGKKLPKKAKIIIKKTKTIDEKIKDIQEQQRLIDAMLALDKKQENCIKQGLTNCGKRKTLIKKIVVKKKKIAIKLPDKPKLVGFFNGTVLFSLKNDQIRSFKEKDKVIHGYQIENIDSGRQVTLSHPSTPKLIFINFTR